VLADAMARNVMYEGSQRESGVTAFAGTQWDWVFYVKPRREAENYSQLDERLQYTYGAIYLSPALGVMKAGPGGNYKDELKKNADGSFDMYFGPAAPAGQESNWIETVPGRGFYVMFRLYSPTEPLFDGTWALPDVELT
jgi:hypothetical protein